MIVLTKSASLGLFVFIQENERFQFIEILFCIFWEGSLKREGGPKASRGNWIPGNLCQSLLDVIVALLFSS